MTRKVLVLPSMSQEFTIKEIIQQALCTISSLQTTKYHKPAAILIGTHVDLTSEAAVLSLDQTIQESFKDADFMKNDVLCTVNKEDEETRYVHPLDNVSEDSTDIEELRELITRIVHRHFPTEEIPTGVLLLQLILRMKFDPHLGWCSVEDCALLEFCCIIYKETRSANEDPVYFMPAVLYPDHNVAKESSDPVLLARLHIPPILFVPSTEYTPLGQFSATAVELSKEWELDETKRYRNRIRFYAKCEGDRLLHVEFRSLSTHLELRVLPQASPQPIDPRLMIESRRMVWKSIDKVASLYSHTRGIRWKLGFYCPQALQLGQHSHPATFKSLDNPQEMCLESVPSA